MSLSKETAEEYLERYKKEVVSSATDSGSVDAFYSSVRDNDQIIRGLFSQQRESWVVPELATDGPTNNAYLSLVPVFDAEGRARPEFRKRALSPTEQALPKVFDLDDKQRISTGGATTVPNFSTFDNNFNTLFSEGLLRHLNWDNVFVAGGSVLACLQPVPEENDEGNRARRKYFHDEAYTGSDLDIFLYGLDEEGGRKKLKEVYEAVCEACPHDVLCFRSSHAVTIVSQYPYRHVQVVLRLYNSPLEILAGFDVDSCAVGFDGTNVWTSQRAHLSLVSQLNRIDMTRRSPSYEMRLAKYAQRGFEVGVEGLERDRVDPMIFERPFSKVSGLAKLMILERLRTPEARHSYREMGRQRSLRRQQRKTYQSFMRDKWLKDRMESFGSTAEASDYSTVFLPWGPTWTALKVQRLMMTKEQLLNNVWVNNFRPYNLHPCFIGSAEEVINDQYKDDPPIPKEIDPASLAMYVRGPLSFLEDNPGRQMIGSFNPITDGDWSEGAYLSMETEAFCAAALVNDTATLKTMLEAAVAAEAAAAAAAAEAAAAEAAAAGAAESEAGKEKEKDKDNKSSFVPPSLPSSLKARDHIGRPPLLLAVMGKAEEAVGLLLQAGADPSEALPDGRNALHVAACYGFSAILDRLLARVTELAGLQKEAAKAAMAAEGQGQEGEGEREAMDVDGDAEEEKEESDNDDEDDEDEDGSEGDSDGSGGGGGAKAKAAEAAAKVQADESAVDYEALLDRPDWENRFTPLHWACAFGHPVCVTSLLRAGSKCVKAGGEPIQAAGASAPYQYGYTPRVAMPILMLPRHLVDFEEGVKAAEEIAKQLVIHGASCGETDASQSNVLRQLAYNGEETYLRIILRADAEAIAKPGGHSPLAQLDRSLHTPLLAAIDGQRWKCAIALMEAGSSPVTDEAACSVARLRAARGRQTYQTRVLTSAKPEDVPDGLGLLLKTIGGKTGYWDPPLFFQGKNKAHATVHKRAEVTQLIMKLVKLMLAKGVDVNRVTKSNESSSRRNNNTPPRGTKPLDVLKKHLEALEEEAVKLKEGENKGDDSSVDDYSDDSNGGGGGKDKKKEDTGPTGGVNRLAKTRKAIAAQFGGGGGPEGMTADGDGDGTFTFKLMQLVLTEVASAVDERVKKAANEKGGEGDKTSKKDGKGNVKEVKDQRTAAWEALGDNRQLLNTFLTTLQEKGATASPELSQAEKDRLKSSRRNRSSYGNDYVRQWPSTGGGTRMLWGDALPLIGEEELKGLTDSYSTVDKGAAQYLYDGNTMWGGHLRQSNAGLLLPSDQQPNYHALFEAVWRNDADAVDRLTTTSEENPARCLVSVRNPLGMTPLTLAILQGHSQMAEKILDIALKQYTPPQKKAKGAAPGVDSSTNMVRLDNYALAAMQDRSSNAYYGADSDGSGSDYYSDEDYEAEAYLHSLEASGGGGEGSDGEDGAQRSKPALAVRCLTPPDCLLAATAVVPTERLVSTGLPARWLGHRSSQQKVEKGMEKRAEEDGGKLLGFMQMAPMQLAAALRQSDMLKVLLKAAQTMCAASHLSPVKRETGSTQAFAQPENAKDDSGFLAHRLLTAEVGGGSFSAFNLALSLGYTDILVTLLEEAGGGIDFGSLAWDVHENIEKERAARQKAQEAEMKRKVAAAAAALASGVTLESVEVGMEGEGDDKEKEKEKEKGKGKIPFHGKRLEKKLEKDSVLEALLRLMKDRQKLQGRGFHGFSSRMYPSLRACAEGAHQGVEALRWMVADGGKAPTEALEAFYRDKQSTSAAARQMVRWGALLAEQDLLTEEEDEDAAEYYASGEVPAPSPLSTSLAIARAARELFASLSATNRAGLNPIHSAIFGCGNDESVGPVLKALKDLFSSSPGAWEAALSAHEEGKIGTPLQVALSNMNTHAVKCLLELKAPVQVASADEELGWSVLHLAAASGKSACLEALLEALTDEQVREMWGPPQWGRDANTRKGITPFHLAVFNGCSAAVQTALLAAIKKAGGSDSSISEQALSAQSESGENALHTAAKVSGAASLKLLLNDKAGSGEKEGGAGGAGGGDVAVVEAVRQAMLAQENVAGHIPLDTAIAQLQQGVLGQTLTRNESDEESDDYYDSEDSDFEERKEAKKDVVEEKNVVAAYAELRAATQEQTDFKRKGATFAEVEQAAAAAASRAHGSGYGRQADAAKQRVMKNMEGGGTSGRSRTRAVPSVSGSSSRGPSAAEGMVESARKDLGSCIPRKK